ncbi:MAG: hypothetical protein V2B18_23930 [Pseudomonadota bacterium]
MAEQVSRDVSAKAAVELLRSSMSNGEVMKTFRLSSRGFADLLKQLYENKLITEEDLTKRGIRFKVQQRKKEAGGETTTTSTPKPLQAPPPPRVRDYDEEEEEEFVDTVTLTEMLTFKAFDLGTPKTADEPQEIAPPEEDDTDSSDKKGRFKITGLFKRNK